MMRLSLSNIGKRYKYHWIFRKVNLDIKEGQVWNISGNNGSGKSTLLKIISGFLSPSEGSIHFEKDGKTIDDYYRHIMYAAPYVDLIPQMTLREQLQFQQNFKSFKSGLTASEVINILDLKSSADKPLNDFSSGMLQRVRIGLAVLAESDLCILDEPTSNLDQEGFEWYAALLKKYRDRGALIIASNEERDFVFSDQSLDIMDFK